MIIKKIGIFLFLGLNLVYLLYLIKPFHVREELVPGYYILSEEHLEQKTQKMLSETVQLKDITFNYKHRNEANNKRVYEVKNINGAAISHLFLIYKDIECVTCEDVLYALMINNRAQITHIFPVKKITMEGKDALRDDFYAQFNKAGLVEKSINLAHLESVTGATPTSENIYEGIVESLILLSGD